MVCDVKKQIANFWQIWEIREEWVTTSTCILFVRNGTEEHCSHPLPSPILPSFLLQGSCTPLMVATLHPPSAGIAPQYSLPFGLGAGVGQPTFLEHTATVLVKQR